MDDSTIDAGLGELVDAIYRRYSYDFRDYAQASQRRRVLHAVQRLGCTSVADLQELVLREPPAFTELLQMLTIPVTQMFRDPPFFLALRRHVAPVLKTYPSLKVWIAGCCTGEEVLSMAILLREEGLLERTMMYATDINPQVLEKAKKGVFALDKIKAYTANYQQAGGRRAFSDYYTAAYDGALFDKTLCENVTFADHSLATDHVFAETHLICCRNVLIYFNRPLQNRSLGLFEESLCHRGFLGLGSKESLNFSAYSTHFEQIGNPEKLYRKR
ncbi:chemotaxis protein methyltransferase CheR [Oxalobacteraceae bacterium GrIS 1.11]